MQVLPSSSQFRRSSEALIRVALGISAVLLLTSRAHAQTVPFKDYSIRQQYLSVRALGMGNAFTAVADDYNALFYNPAGLARLEEGQINLSLIGASLDSKVIPLKNDIDNVSKEPDATRTTDMVNLLNKNLGNHYSTRAEALTAFWVRPHWGFAIIPVEFNLEAEIQPIALLNVVATQDTTIAFGRGWDAHWFDHANLSFGLTGKAIYRASYANQLDGLALAMNTDVLHAQDAHEGFTVDGDFGMLLSPKGEAGSGWGRLFHPTLGLAIRNLADYGYLANYHLISKTSSNDPPKLGRRYDAGLKWDLPDWWIWKVHAVADLRDMGTENWTFKKGSHAGVEMLWKIRSWWQGGWRAGVNQGYFTAGFTGKFGIFNLDLATSAEEVGTTDTPKADRRYVARASLDW